MLLRVQHLKSRLHAWAYGHPLLWNAIVLLSFVIAAGWYSLHRGQDVNWDLKNYHYYNAYAYLHDRLTFDIAPAQLQSYHNPLLDLPFYGLVALLNDWPRVIAFVMALPAALAVFFLFRTLNLAMRDAPDREAHIVIAMLFGICGAAGISQWGSTMNEWHVTALAMAAVFVVVRAAARSTLSWQALLLAGVISGAAAGLKLTASVSCTALFVALLALDRRGRSLLPFALGAGAGLLAVSGAWMLTLYEQFESPLFPYFNNVFQSPWIEARDILPKTFNPKSLTDAVLFPLGMLKRNSLASEPSLRDWHLPFLYLAGLALVLKSLGARAFRLAELPALDPLDRFLVAYVLTYYVLWLAVFAIYRYLIPLELLSGWLLAVLLRKLLPQIRLLPWLAVALAVLWAMKLNPNWGRVPFGERFFDVVVPAIPDNALVLLSSEEPLAYVVPFFPAKTRFAGLDNILPQAGQGHLLERKLRDTIARREGPIFALDVAGRQNFVILDKYGLAVDRSTCQIVTSNMDRNGLALCRVTKL